MSGTPWLTWDGVHAVGYRWPPPGAPSPNPDAGPPTINLVHGAGTPPQSAQSTNTLEASVLVSGSSTSWQAGQQTGITGQTTKGSSLISGVVPNLTGLYVGQPIFQPNGVFGQGILIPNGCEIQALIPGTPPSIVITGKAWDTSVAAIPLTATDTEPNGYLIVTVTPSTGVTLYDNNFDGTTDSRTTGTAQMISNYSKAEGNFYAAFASAGNFSVSVAFASTDTNYTGATIQHPLTVVVT